MNLTRQIIAILNRDGEVIVPGLGGFSAGYRPAAMDLQKHRFSPPSRKLAFSTTAGEGTLLTAEIIRSAGIHQEEAERLVRDFVQHILHVLRQEDTYVFAGLGSLRLMKTGNMVFIPDAAFESGDEFMGLESFSLEPVLTDDHLAEMLEASPDPIPEFKEQDIDNTPETLLEVTSPKKGNRPAMVFGWLLAFLGLVLLALAWVHKDEVGKAVKAITHRPPIQTENPTPIQEVEPITHPEPDWDLSLSDTLSIAKSSDSISLQDESGMEAQVIHLEGVMYYLVAGAFREEEKANRLVEELRIKEYPAHIFEQTPGGLHVVCYGAFPAREDALETMKVIRVNENPEVWLKRVEY